MNRWIKGALLALFLALLVIIQFIPGEDPPAASEAPEAGS